MLSILIYGLIYLSKKSKIVWDKLHLLQNRVYDATTTFELEQILEELKEVRTFNKPHYYEVDKIMALIKLKMQYTNKKTE